METWIIRNTLSDGSHTYDVRARSDAGEVVEFACTDADHAQRLADAIRGTVDLVMVTVVFS